MKGKQIKKSEFDQTLEERLESVRKEIRNQK
jgi:hypothetical protein